MHHCGMARKGTYGKGKVGLAATSLLETVVATVVFLIVFGMAMGASVNLRRLGSPDWARIETDFNAVRARMPEDGQVYEYDWGEIGTECSEYLEIPGLLDVRVTIKLKDGRRSIYRYLYCDGLE